MDRTNAPGATPAHLYTEGDPGMGIPATTVSAVALNAFQEELVGIIEAASIVPNEANNGQVKAALDILYAPAGGYTAINDKVTKLATYLHASGSVVITSGTPGTAASITLTPGTWLLEGDLCFSISGGTITHSILELRGEGSAMSGDASSSSSASVANGLLHMYRGPRVLTVSEPTACPLSGFASFSAGVCTLSGWVTARRLDV